jgi:signal transduction histidine kinase
MSSALDQVPGGVISLSHDLRVLGANRAMGVLVRCPSADLVGQQFDVLLSPPSRILFQTHVYPALNADGRVEEVLLSLGSRDGDSVPVLFNAVARDGPDGPAYDCLVVRILARARWDADLLAATRALERERTESQRLAQELAAAAEDLAARHAEELRNREFRDAFVGVISHELRTPITTIAGMSHLLRQRHNAMDPQVVSEQLGDIEAESDRLARLMEDLLVLSQTEGGGLQLASDPISIAHVVRAVVERERAHFAGHHVMVDAEARLPPVRGEELYVEQVVRNYLTNAAKYSPAGTTVRVTVTSETGGVAVRVIDAGPGLGEQAPERLFDLFYRAPDAISQAAGAGIGLFVCRELVKAMGGRVWAAAAPAPGPGAEFGFWLPAASDDGADDV